MFSLSGKIQEMPRLNVPGEAVVQFGAGEHIGFLETQSVVDGEVVFGNPSVNCTIASLDGSGDVSISPPGASTSYSFGAYSGNSVMVVSTPKAGEYRVDCRGSGSGALAFGQGIGMLIVVAVVGGVLGLLVAMVLFFRIRKRRRAFAASYKPLGSQT